MAAAAAASAAAATTTTATTATPSTGVYVSTSFYGQRFGTNLVGQDVLREIVVSTLYEQDLPSSTENFVAL